MEKEEKKKKPNRKMFKNEKFFPFYFPLQLLILLFFM